MPSNAYRGHLIPLLGDAEELDDARAQLRLVGPAALTRDRAAALNRATVVICVSAWEAYVEELVRESLATLRPAGTPDPTWDVLAGPTLRVVQRFNTPDAGQVRQLLRETLRVPDVTTGWAWRGMTPDDARGRLQRAMELRHQVAHGVNPPPAVTSHYASDLPNFFRRLGRCTDAAVRLHLVNALGIPNPWPS